MVCCLPVIFLKINKFTKSFIQRGEKYVVSAVGLNTPNNFWVPGAAVRRRGAVCVCAHLSPSLSLPKQAHSNQQCNWNATTVWRRKGNFWQGETEQLGALFRLKHRRPFIISTTHISNSIALCFYSWDLF